MLINFLGKSKEKWKDIPVLTEYQIEKAVWEIWCESVKDPNRSNEDYKLIFCKSWLSCTHKAWYGETEIFSSNDNSNIKAEYFLCEGCKNNNKNVCILWNQTNGIMKKLEDEDNYIHLWCALLCDDFYIIDYDKMDIKRYSIWEYVNLSKWMFWSSNKGFLLSWDEKGCKQKAHAFWLYKNKRESTLTYSSEKEDTSWWQVVFSNWIYQDAIGCQDLALNTDYWYKILNNWNNKWKWRGGLVNIYCDKHPPCEINWYWRSDGEFDGLMVSCDFWGT